jgi:REP element-mobilizing transposase RayT
VWARGIERRAIFTSTIDRLDFLERLAQLVHAGCLAVYAWALMGNHFHLLVRTGHRGLSSSMRILLGGYATAFNLRRNRTGHLFQNRFKSTLVDREAYFLELVRYIHLNPVRAKVVADLEALDRYRWTGHASLLGHHTWSWYNCDVVLSQFGSTLSAARDAYRTFVADALAVTEPVLDGGGMRRWGGVWTHLQQIARGREAWSFDERIPGDDRFAGTVLDQLNTIPAPPARRAPAPEIIAHLVAELVRRTGCSTSELVSNSKRPDVVRARQALCYIAVCHAALPIRHVAQCVRIHPTTVLRSVRLGAHALSALGCAAAELLPADLRQ